MNLADRRGLFLNKRAEGRGGTGRVGETWGLEVAFPNVEDLSRGFPAQTWLAVRVDVNRAQTRPKVWELMHPSDR